MSFKTSDVSPAAETSSDSARLPWWAGPCVYATFATMAINVVLAAAYFAVGGIWGPMSDLGGLAHGFTVFGVSWVVYVLHRQTAPRGSALTFAAGVLAAAATCVGSTLLVLAALDFVLVAPAVALGTQFAGSGVLGLWLLGVGWLGIKTNSVPDHIALAAILAGLGILSLPLTAGTLGFETPLLYAGLTVGLFSYLLWAFWFARALATNDVGDATPMA